MPGAMSGTVTRRNAPSTLAEVHARLLERGVEIFERRR